MVASTKSFELVKSNYGKGVGFAMDEASAISTDEIQCMMYDLNVSRLELELQNNELLRHQRELIDAHNRMNFIYHNIPVGVVALNEDGFIEKFNKTFSEMLRERPGVLNKKHFFKFVADEDKNCFINQYEAFFKSTKIVRLKIRLVGRDGRMLRNL